MWPHCSPFRLGLLAESSTLPLSLLLLCERMLWPVLWKLLQQPQSDLTIFGLPILMTQAPHDSLCCRLAKCGQALLTAAVSSALPPHWSLLQHNTGNLSALEGGAQLTPASPELLPVGGGEAGTLEDRGNFRSQGVCGSLLNCQVISVP